MRSRLPLLLFLSLRLSHAFCQGNYHQTVYEPTDFDGLRAAPAHCDDGSVLLLTEEMDHAVIRKIGPLGAAIWSRSLVMPANAPDSTFLPTDPWKIESTSDGGAVILMTRRVSAPNRLECYLTRIDGAGDALWSKRFDVPGAMVIQYSGAKADLAISGADELFLSTPVWWSSDTTCAAFNSTIIKISPFGDQLWAKTVGICAFTVVFGAVSDEAGGCYFLGSPVEGGTQLLGRLDANGVLMWIGSFDSFSPFVQEGPRDMRRGPSGDVFVAGSYGYTGDPWRGTVKRFSPTGQGLWGAYVEANHDISCWSVRETASGEVLCTTSLWQWDETERAVVVRLSSSGSVIDAHQSAVDISTGSEVYIEGWIQDVQEDTLLLAGRVFGATSPSLFHWRIGSDMSNACFLEPATVTGTAGSAFNLGAVQTYWSDAAITIDTSGITLDTLAGWVGTDFCAWMTTVTVEEQDAAQLSVCPSLLTAGEPIQVALKGPAVVQVLDPQGRAVMMRKAQGTMTIETAGWAVGLYMVSVEEVSTHRHQSQKVMVE